MFGFIVCADYIILECPDNIEEYWSILDTFLLNISVSFGPINPPIYF